MAKIIIKKYDNRKLYNTNEGKYNNLKEVIELMREGNDVKVYKVTKDSSQYSHKVKLTNDITNDTIWSYAYINKDITALEFIKE